MNRKVKSFILTFALYIMFFLLWHNWSLTDKEIAEMFFIGTLCSLVYALTINRMRGIITTIVQKLVGK
jgi:RsiW-degrading membrane proteinase PrsW (M82 family)